MSIPIKRVIYIEQPACAPREVVERTREYLLENDYTLRLIEWVSTPAGGFLQGSEYRFSLDSVGGRVCWRVAKRSARSSEWVYLFHAQLERAIAYLWQQGCGWWRPHSARRLWLQVVELPREALSDDVEW